MGTYVSLSSRLACLFPWSATVALVAGFLALSVWPARADAWGYYHRGYQDRVATVRAPARDALPNPGLTPGATNPNVTQATLRETVCVPGYSKSIRPPERYTEALKRRQLREYSYADQKIWHYEEDHLVPLSIGGSPTSPRNLWPEPHHVDGGWGSFAKDRLEYFMWKAVCAGEIPLRMAQHVFETNWVAGYERYIGPDPDNTPLHGEWTGSYRRQP